MAAWGRLTSWHGGGTGRVDELIQQVDARSRGEGGRVDTLWRRVEG